MNTTIQRIRQKGTSRKGFTLPEMLIVIAIIAVLIAIAIPVLTSQLNSAKESVDVANLRAAKSMAVATTLATSPAPSANVTYVAIVNADGVTMEVVKEADLGSKTPYAPQASANSGKRIEVEVTPTGSIVSGATTGWVTP